MQQRIEWPRAKVMELLTKGESNQSEIALILQVDKSFVCMDIAYLRQQAKTNIKRYIDERLPEEYGKCLVRLNAIFTDSVYMYCLIRDIISSWSNNKEVSCMLHHHHTLFELPYYLLLLSLALHDEDYQKHLVSC
jgi:hypothetical protein